MKAVNPPKDPARVVRASAALASGGAVLFGAAWYGALMRPVWAAASLGPICGHQGLLVLHCPACYAAMSLVAVGLAGLTWAPRPGLTAICATPAR